MRSQRVRLQNRDGIIVAIIHRFRHYTGELGGSGEPDPKAVLVESEWWVLRRSSD
jgi:hypothetical protein